jgi:hypothetical protein
MAPEQLGGPIAQDCAHGITGGDDLPIVLDGHHGIRHGGQEDPVEGFTLDDRIHIAFRIDLPPAPGAAGLKDALLKLRYPVPQGF